MRKVGAAMTPVNRHELSERQVWLAIQYLDPDLEGTAAHDSDDQPRKKKIRNGKLVGGLIALAGFAAIAALRYFHVIAKLIN